MIHWLTINNNPSNPQQPIQQPYVKRTGKFQFASKRQQFGRFGMMIPPESPEVRSSWRLVRWSDLGTRHGLRRSAGAGVPARVRHVSGWKIRLGPLLSGDFSRESRRDLTCTLPRPYLLIAKLTSRIL